MTRFVLLSAVIAASAGCSARSERVNGGGNDRTRNGTCTADCNGALPTTECVLLDPTLYASGLAFCTSDCTPDLSYCREHVPKTALAACTGTGQGNCQSGLLCLTDDTETICVQPCELQDSTPCTNSDTECRLSQNGTDAGCFAADPGLPPDQCLQVGELLCDPEFDLLLRCSPVNTWGIEEDCAIAGEVCGDPPTSEPRCIGTDECFNVGEIRCGTGERLQICAVDVDDGIVYQTTADCGAVSEVCAEVSPGVLGCRGPDACISTGETRCTADRLETCDGATFRFTSDCAQSGEFCRAESGGFACVPATNVCAYIGHDQSLIFSFFDDDVLDRLWLIVDTPAVSSTERLALEIVPEVYVGATFPLQIDLADHAGRDTCTFCMTGMRQLNIYTYDTAPTYMPMSGTAIIDLFPTQPGEPISITFQNVIMREVDIVPGSNQTIDVPGGDLWCLTNEAYAVSTTRFVCAASNDPIAEGETVCLDPLTQMRCQLGFLDSIDCYGQGLVCANSDPLGNATCELCQSPAICRDTEIVSCDAGVVSLTECATGGEVCMVPAVGQDAECQGCDRIGIQAIKWAPLFDHDVMRYLSIQIFNDALTEVLFIENFPDFGGMTAPGTHVIQPTDSMASGTRVYLGIYDAVTAVLLRRFFARSGTLDFNQLPLVAGDFVNITITDLRLQEVDLQWQDLPGGESWCVPFLNIGGQTMRYPCSFLGGAGFIAGESMCNGTQVVSCTQQPSLSFPTVAEQEDCADLGQGCIDTTSGGTQSAACQ